MFTIQTFSNTKVNGCDIKLLETQYEKWNKKKILIVENKNDTYVNYLYWIRPEKEALEKMEK